MPSSGAFSGRTAAWLHGLDATPCEPIEAILPGDGEGWERGGSRVRRAALDDYEVALRRGFRTTSLARTLWDLSRILSLVESFVMSDMALHPRSIPPRPLREWVDLNASGE